MCGKRRSRRANARAARARSHVEKDPFKMITVRLGLVVVLAVLDRTKFIASTRGDDGLLAGMACALDWPPPRLPPFVTSSLCVLHLPAPWGRQVCIVVGEATAASVKAHHILRQAPEGGDGATSESHQQCRQKHQERD